MFGVWNKLSWRLSASGVLLYRPTILMLWFDLVSFCWFDNRTIECPASRFYFFSVWHGLPASLFFFFLFGASVSIASLSGLFQNSQLSIKQQVGDWIISCLELCVSRTNGCQEIFVKLSWNLEENKVFGYLTAPHLFALYKLK